MIVFFQTVISLLPFLILFLAIVLVLLFIFICRNHTITFSVTIFSIVSSLISLYFVWKNGRQCITDLICIDGFSILCMILILVAALSISMISHLWLSRSYAGNCDEFYLLLLIFIIGSIVVINSSHMVTLFLGIELLSLPLYGLMSYVNIYKNSLEATVKYVVLSSISTSFLLFGIALIYLEIAHLSFVDISLELSKKFIHNQSIILMSGIAMMLVGFGFKLSLVPFHLWTADVYKGIPEIAGICLATINKIAIFSVLVRFFYLFPEFYTQVNYILVFMSCFSILFGNLMAIHQDNIKRILAYSSISQMGYLLVGIIGNMQKRSYDCSYGIHLLSDSIEVICVYLVNYLITTLGVFSILGLVYCFYSNREEDIGTLSLYRGLFWKDPILSIAFSILILSLSGVPITLGFVSKFYLIVLSIQKELWFCTIFIIFGTVIGILYYLRVVTTLYLTFSLKDIKKLSVIWKQSEKGVKSINHDMRFFIFMRKNFFTKCMMTSSGIFVLFSSLLLLIFGVYPEFLIYLFSVIQKKF